MATITSYSDARARLSELCDEVVNNRDVVIITRRRQPKVALIAADELASLMETAHLLRSPKNAERLLSALNRAVARTESTSTIAELRGELGLGKEEKR